MEEITVSFHLIDERKENSSPLQDGFCNGKNDFLNLFFHSNQNLFFFVHRYPRREEGQKRTSVLRFFWISHIFDKEVVLGKESTQRSRIACLFPS